MSAGGLLRLPRPALFPYTTLFRSCRSKLAVTVVVAVRVTVQEPVPEQPLPLQPVKVEPGAGAAVREIGRASWREREQLAPEVVPAGALVRVPRPGPALLKVSVLGWPVE